MICLYFRWVFLCDLEELTVCYGMDGPFTVDPFRRFSIAMLVMPSCWMGWWLYPSRFIHHSKEDWQHICEAADTRCNHEYLDPDGEFLPASQKYLGKSANHMLSGYVAIPQISIDSFSRLVSKMTVIWLPGRIHKPEMMFLGWDSLETAVIHGAWSLSGHYI